MSNNTPINLRIKFKKVGNLQYISHLDLVRTMHKIVVRSKLPLWYTEGFNPKPKMVFAAPLSIGTESLCEYMDLRLNERVEPELAKKALNDNMTDELVVTEAYYPEAKLTELKWLAYTITVASDNADSAMAARCDAALAEEKIIITKRTKSGEAEVDIKPLIKTAATEYKDGAVVINCVLSSDSSAYLNPEHIVKYLRAECGILSLDNLLSESYSILRTCAYKDNMKEFN